MKRKYYAVRKGQTTGIFSTWDDCRDAVNGFPGAEYKSFENRADAEYYFENGITRNSEEKETDDPAFFAEEGTVVAFVDGSYDVTTGNYGFGCVMIEPDGSVTEKNGSGDSPEAAVSRNVAGELLATMNAAAFAIKNGYRKLKVYHDYNGISKWYTKQWKTESFAARAYVGFMDRTKSALETEFVKVEAHTGVHFNERADILAKEALGLK